MTRGSKRPVGLTKDGSYQVGARRTMMIEPSAAWDLVTSARGLAAWLGPLPDGALSPEGDYRLADGTRGEVRIYQAGSHLRLTWWPPDWDQPSLLQLRVIPKGERSAIALHQEGLPSARTRAERKRAFHAALDQLERLIG